MTESRYKLHLGDCLEVMRGMEAQSVHCVVTSPPYYGLRDYGHEGQIGLEETPEQYVAKLVAVFREVRRVLRDDGTVWLNLGDSYVSSATGSNGANACMLEGGRKTQIEASKRPDKLGFGLQSKNLIGIPWRVAFALQADGWYLRQDIIWHKPNPMPESVTDRCTKAHEYIFLLSKSARYYYDHEAVKEPATSYNAEHSARTKTGANIKGNMSERGVTRTTEGLNAKPQWEKTKEARNRRSVWTVSTKPYKEAHFATYPPELITPCILAGCPVGGVTLDPFNGSGTTGEVAILNGRRYVGIELNTEYLHLAIDRIGKAEVQYRNASGEIVVTAKERERGMVSLFDWAGQD